MSTFESVKERLNKKMKPSEVMFVKQALYGYMAKYDPELQTKTWEKLALEELLPFLQELSPLWTGMKDDDFVTSYPLINSLYHCIRNQFKSVETLRKRVQEFIDDQEDLEVDSIQEPPKPGPQTRHQDKVSTN